MLGLAVCMVLIGCFVLYNTSKKVTLGNASVELWLQGHAMTAKVIGIGCLLLGFAFSIKFFGLMAGILFWLILLMTLLGLLIILFPLKIISYKSVVGLSILIFILEILI